MTSAAVLRLPGDSDFSGVAEHAPERVSSTTPTSDFFPVSEEFDFFSNSWAQIGADGTFRIGAFPARSEVRTLRSIYLPAIGDALVQGEPFTTLRAANGVSQAFPAPISGVVIEVNDALKIDPNPVWQDPCHRGWVARVRASRPLRDLWVCAPRRVVLFCCDPVMRSVQQNWLGYYGCSAHVVTSTLAAVHLLRDLPADVLVADGRSLGRQGPQILEQIRRAVPATCVIAVTTPGSKWEAIYRNRGITCCTVDAVFDYDLADMLHAAFRLQRKESAPVLDVGERQ